VTALLTPTARRHINHLLRAVNPYARSLDRRFGAWLRAQGQGAGQVRALRAITPATACHFRSLPAFFEEVSYQGRRLAKLHVSPTLVAEALREFDRTLAEALHGTFIPAREHLYLVVELLLRDAFYRVREEESQAFFALARAEAEARDVDDLLRRFGAVLTKAFHARAGILLLKNGDSRHMLSRPHYIQMGENAESLLDQAVKGNTSYWSYPFGPSAVLQLGFAVPYRWLPRERALLAAAALRCQEAIERARMAREIKRLEAESRRAEEEERKRIGRELHDEAGQSMAFLRLQLEMLARDTPPPLRARVAEASDLAARTAQELRRIIAALSPSVLERLGLARALRHLGVHFRQRHAARLTLRIGRLPVRPPQAIAEVIYRVAQESLNNVVKHSRAQRVNLSLSHADKSIRLRVRDNGGGFCADEVSNQPKSFGLAGMRERAALLGGTLEISSAPAEGTSVRLELPLKPASVIAHGKDTPIVD
jgi:signal transduction histidine kinase